MQQRKPLTAGLSVVPPDADPEAVRAFLKQDHSSEQGGPSTESQTAVARDAEPTPTKLPNKARRDARGPVPVGLIPVTVRLKPALAGALKRASLQRQLNGDEPATQQEIVEQALEPWLRGEGYLS